MATDNRLIAAHLAGAMLGKGPWLKVGEKPEHAAAKLYFEVLAALDAEAEKHKGAEVTGQSQRDGN
jgi:hypothetical protein